MYHRLRSPSEVALAGCIDQGFLDGLLDDREASPVEVHLNLPLAPVVKLMQAPRGMPQAASDSVTTYNWTNMRFSMPCQRWSTLLPRGDLSKSMNLLRRTVKLPPLAPK